eukprot:SAG31_NODE_35112_length_326_cov_0.687225_1_plen_49_part_10
MMNSLDNYLLATHQVTGVAIQVKEEEETTAAADKRWTSQILWRTVLRLS